MPRILIADDDLTQLALRKMLLESAGHQVRASFSPADTLRQVAQGWADLVILDLCMPRSADGLELIRGIRESGCNKPVIVLSGWPADLYGQPEERMVSRVLEKPPVIADLLGAIAAVAPGR